MCISASPSESGYGRHRAALNRHRQNYHDQDDGGSRWASARWAPSRKVPSRIGTASQTCECDEATLVTREPDPARLALTANGRIANAAASHGATTAELDRTARAPSTRSISRPTRLTRSGATPAQRLHRNGRVQ
jgi:hypothetical protein